MPTSLIADIAVDSYNTFCLPSVQTNGKTAVDCNDKPDILNTEENIYHWCKTFGGNIFGSERKNPFAKLIN